MSKRAPKRPSSQEKTVFPFLSRSVLAQRMSFAKSTFPFAYRMTSILHATVAAMLVSAVSSAIVLSSLASLSLSLLVALCWGWDSGRYRFYILLSWSPRTGPFLPSTLSKQTKTYFVVGWMSPDIYSSVTQVSVGAAAMGAHTQASMTQNLQDPKMQRR